MLEMMGVEWREWAHQRQTQEFLKLLLWSVREIQAAWSNRDYTASDPMTTAQLNAGALGSIDALQQIIQSIEDAKQE